MHPVMHHGISQKQGESTAQRQNPILDIYNPIHLSNPSPYGYSHIVEVTAFSRILHLAGQGGENSEGYLASHFAAQLTQCFKNIEIGLHSRTATFADIAILRILVVEHNVEKHQLLIQEMNRIWKNHTFPACTLIPVPCLAIADMLIEIEATAYCS